MAKGRDSPQLFQIESFRKGVAQQLVPFIVGRIEKPAVEIEVEVGAMLVEPYIRKGITLVVEAEYMRLTVFSVVVLHRCFAAVQHGKEVVIQAGAGKSIRAVVYRQFLHIVDIRQPAPDVHRLPEAAVKCVEVYIIQIYRRLDYQVPVPLV